MWSASAEPACYTTKSAFFEEAQEWRLMGVVDTDEEWRRFEDCDFRDSLVTARGRICLLRKKINISTVLAGQRLGIKEVDDGIWPVTFIKYDYGYIDLESRNLQPIDNPFGPRLSPMSPGRT
jgi:hypothetical protein